MGNIRLGPDISRLGSDADIAGGYIEEWRLEVPEQWSRTGVEMDREALAHLLRAWEARGQEYALFLYVALGNEWLFRARKPTPEDLEEQLLQIEAGLSNPLHPVLTPVQARLVVNAIGPSLLGELEKHRILVSLKQWALPRPPAGWEAEDLKARKLERPTEIVEMKPGVIARVGPIVASIISEDLLKGANCSDVEAKEFACESARILLGRELPIPDFEYGRWKARIKELPADSEMRKRKLDQPENLLGALHLRWRQSYEIALRRGGWDGFLLELSRDPKVVFEHAANLEVISMLYSVDWGTKDMPDRWEGSWGIKKVRPNGI